MILSKSYLLKMTRIKRNKNDKHILILILLIVPVSLGDSRDRAPSYGHRNRLGSLDREFWSPESLGNFPELGR